MRGRETSISCLIRLPLTPPQLGTEPAAQACTLTTSPTSDLSLCRMMPNQMSHAGQGRTFYDGASN